MCAVLRTSFSHPAGVLAGFASPPSPHIEYIVHLLLAIYGFGFAFIHRTVDILVNNAGMEAMDAVPTTDGIERVYQVSIFYRSLPKFRRFSCFFYPFVVLLGIRH